MNFLPKVQNPKHPIEIAEIDGKKIIIDGHHRARAAGAAGIKKVPVVVSEITPEQAIRYLREAAEAADFFGLPW
jgi:ParB-like chromosome segregation protein Spo0J